MAEPQPFAPVAVHERIAAMDVLRGFALLGILLMNIEAMAGPLLIAQTGLDPALTGVDRLADAFVYLFVQGKFYPLFSLLFGMGFAVMLARADAAQQPFFMVYLCRVLALLAIGLAHALLVWSGDILVSYALVAFVMLLLFRSTPAPYLAVGGVLLILFAEFLLMTLGALGQLAMHAPDMQEAVAAQREEIAATIEAQRLAGTSESWSAAIAQRRDDLSNSLTSLLLWGWQILGLFLLGAWFVRSGAIARPDQFPRFYARLRTIALPIGFLMVVLSFLIEPTFDLVSLDLRSASALSLFNVGGTLMALGYLAWIVCGLQGGPLSPWLAKLAPAGRMALSNYLAQSLVCTWIFSGYGLGYFERLPRAWQIPFVLVFFAVQVLASQAWLSRYRMGPMEWLWRAATYLRLPPMRR
jgi:uncharacterized protein